MKLHDRISFSVTNYAGCKILNTLQLPNICISSIKPHRGTVVQFTKNQSIYDCYS